MNKRRIEFEGFVGEVELYSKKIGETTYDVFLKEGQWPVSRDLIILCDGGDPYSDLILCTGGKVSDTSFGPECPKGRRTVKVYV